MADNLIRNYGIHWNRDRVLWGAPGQPGKLLGIPARQRRAKPTDFREQSGVYVLYDSFRIVYVGQSGVGDQALLIRLKQHLRDHLAARWTTFSWFGIFPVNEVSRTIAKRAGTHPSLETSLNHIEAVLIAASEPPLNRQGGRFGGDTEEYIQSDDEDLPGNVIDRLDDVDGALDEIRKRIDALSRIADRISKNGT